MKEKIIQLYKEIDNIDKESTLKYEIAQRFEMKIEERSILQLVYQKEKILQLIRATFTDIDFNK